MGDGVSFRALGATFLAAGLSALGAWALVAQSSCALSNCDGDTVFVNGSPPVDGEIHRPAPPHAGMIDENTWQSSPIDDDWLIYSPQRSFIFTVDPHSSVHRVPIGFDAYVSPTQLADDRDTIRPELSLNPSATQFALAAGNISEISGIDPFDEGPHADANNHTFNFTIHNDTCAPFLLRVVVHLAPLTSGTLDAGTADAASTDAALIDAPSDTLDAGTTDAPLDVADSGPIDASAHD